ncbi:ribonuclease Z [Paenibacillus physcomitrellae]|uniref:Ribonuclease Z n=1 Tax=Paenibacillus physcomitrellae TaxID=1619311 RepID=A0ABQ1FRM3_9BACL|nr:ribonuclease Z [Paenibacillus physcomitrellae]GGA24936.1 ribonuclease Z [Paenibacillus physcomitrellae]
MELYFMGTNAGVPSLQRNVTSLALRMLDERRSFWLFDCGEGTQHQVLRSPLRLSKLEKVFITHLHGDHLFGLPGLLSSRANQGGDTPLTVYGPKGLKSFIDLTLGISESRINYELIVQEHEGGLLFEDDTFRVESALLEHRIDSYGYRIVEKDRPGKLDFEILKKHGIQPGPLYGRLKRGENIVTEQGTVVRSSEVLGKPKKGRIVTILGDTRPCQAAIDLARNADMLVHEATFLHELKKTAYEYHHSTAVQAADDAKAAGAHEMFMTHFSSRYKDEEQLAPLLEEAKAIFPNAKLAVEHVLYPITKYPDKG